MSKTGKNVIGVLHPGAMGTSLAAALVKVGHRVYWASENRSVESAQRATANKLHDCKTLASLCKECNVIFSVCPPSEALTVAQAIAASGFNGTYVDCNAVSPSTSNSVADVMTAVDIDYVDGGVIGPPAWSEGTTRLFLSGPKADEIAELFSGSLMGTVNLGEKTDTASAMKMAYAAWTKGSSALLLSVFALAEHHNLGDALKKEWGLSQPGLDKKLSTAAIGNAPKAWRFVGEMQQIAATLEDAGQNPGAFTSASDIYAAMSAFKTSNSEDITVAAVVQSIIDGKKQT